MLIYTQEQIFIFFFIIGIIIGFLFDIFRVLRKSFNTPDFITLIEDILYLSITGVLIIYSIIKLNNGNIRFFIFVAIFVGILIYSLTIGKLCVIIFYVIVESCKKIFLFPILLIKKIINKIKK